MEKYPVIIIGAGIGGLSAAAYLSMMGIQPIVIEQTPFIGGRCYTRVIDNVEYDIGALYIGERAPQILKSVFRINCSYRPYRIGVKIDDSIVSIPFGWRTLRELHSCKTPLKSIFNLIIKTPAFFSASYFDRFKSVGDVLDSLIKDEIIRKVGYILFGALGVSPYRLPSHYLRMDKQAVGTRVGNPVYFSGGNKQIANLLAAFVEENNGQFVFQEKVQQIIVENNSSLKVITNNNKYFSDFVISNVYIQTTVLKLCRPELWEDAYIKEITSLKKPLSLVCVFVTFDSSVDFPDDFGVFFLPGGHPAEEFHALENGMFPKQSTFALQVPTNLEAGENLSHHATIQFYHPKGIVDEDAVEQQAHKIMTDGLEQLFSGLSNHVLSYKVYDPEMYKQEFDLRPFVFGVSPDLNYRRFRQQTPIPNLFCVGDSVQPDRPGSIRSF